MNIVVFFSILAATFHTAFSLTEKGCPDSKAIAPCSCDYDKLTHLFCDHLSDAETLRTVFKNSEGFLYNEVYVRYSTLKYLPQEMFKNVKVVALHLINITLAQVFEESPESVEDLKQLDIENTRALRGVIWEILEPLKNLRILSIYDNSIKTLGSEFSQYASKNLERFSLYFTETETIKPGVFADFPKLNEVAIFNGKLRTLTRDIFPTPWNGYSLFFSANQLTEIPKGLFSQMPNLQYLILSRNQLSVLPQDAFDGNFGGIKYLTLDNNPLKCDCSMKWIITDKPEMLRGKCEMPKDKQGKNLKDLVPEDFHCQ
ncbi:hypothetical protein CDAR_177881 [Caerostris darwini]|uniref:Uncharacterized protein n=1 Tax=Caerostris darwini TaxID=1538125 RepID=A0AAV4T9T0_9ARAC|nr:hypothetical protein CDAR_177881 [Caerostris darwini]